jgi:hypothetical protein
MKNLLNRNIPRNLHATRDALIGAADRFRREHGQKALNELLAEFGAADLNGVYAADFQNVLDRIAATPARTHVPKRKA